MNIPNLKLGWRIALVILGLLALYAVLARLVWNQENPWARYGVTVTEGYGESDTWIFVNFYLTRNGKKIEGPRVVGDLLSVTYQPRADSSIPNAVVRSDVYHNCYVIVRLNISDPSKPEFEIPKKTCLDVSYAPAGY